MFINNLSSQEKNLVFPAGNYQINLLDFPTFDPLDLFVLTGDNNLFEWRYLDGQFGNDWREPYENNSLAIYADEVAQGLTLEIRVIDAGSFTLRTDDTFEYPNDDTPSHPTVDVEILPLTNNYYSVIADDRIGAVDKNILSTDSWLGAVSSQLIQANFFHDLVNLSQYGVEGSAALWGTEPGLNQLSITLVNSGEVLFWDGEKLLPLTLNEGENQLLLNTVSDEWGLVLLDYFNPNQISTLTVNSLKWLDEDYGVDSYRAVSAIGDSKTDIFTNTYMVGTGTNDKSVRTLGKILLGERNSLLDYGTEGSSVTISGLDTGVYQFDLSIYSKEQINNDALYAWNGKSLTLIADLDNGLITNSVEVVYDRISFIGLDVNSKTGTTDFNIGQLTKVSELDYPAPVPIALIPDQQLGDVDLYSQQTRIGTGKGDRAISTLSRELEVDLRGLGTEGSYATWNVENGIYQVTYQVYTREEDRDEIYFFDGLEVSLLASSDEATRPKTSNRFVSEWKNTEVKVTNQELTLIALDTVDQSGTTQLRISSLERIDNLSEFDPITGQKGEPPYPIPARGWDLGDTSALAWNMGTLKPWESDTNTGITWNQGYVYGSYHLGHSYISEKIGAEDVTDWAVFNLDEASYLNFFHSGAIAEIVNSNLEVVVGSNDSYAGNLQAYLAPGEYYVHFSSESSRSELFSASIYLSKFDPNYAD